MSLTEGQLVGGHYRVKTRLGGGGFGETYLSEDLHLPDRPLRVIKRLSPRIQEESVLQLSRRLFETEAQVLYRLGAHPQIPQLFAHFEELSEFYLVQEYINGNDLSHELLRGKVWEQFSVVHLLQNLLTVLSFVHKNHVIHRDIKPENIIRRRDGQLFLIDFGVVKQIATPTMIASGNAERYTVGIGTPGYMPSEQAHGEPKFASDLYAIGMIGIQALTGMPPNHLQKDDQLEVIWREYAPKVYPEFADILSKMVKFDFRQRYPTAEAAYEAIKEFADRYPISSVNHSLPTIPITFETKLISDSSSSGDVSDRPVAQSGLVKSLGKSSPSVIWEYIQPWHIGLGIITFGAIAITTILVLLDNPSKTTRKAVEEPEISPTLIQEASVSNPTRFTSLNSSNPKLWKEFANDNNDEIYGVKISPDMSIIAGGSSNRNIELWNLQTGQKLPTFKGHTGRVYDIYFSPDGKRLVSASDDRKVMIWDVKTGKILNTLEGHQERVYTAIFSPDGKIVASSSADRTIRLWNAETGQLINILQDKSWIYDVSFTPDGKLLASGSKDGAIRLWDVATGKVVKTLQSSGSAVRSLIYSNDGKTIASAIADNTVRLWDGKSGQLKDVLTGHTNGVHTLAFSSNDQLLATGSADKTIRLWDLKGKNTVQVLADHELGVSSVDFSNDQTLLISGGLDGKIKVWKIK